MLDTTINVLLMGNEWEYYSLNLAQMNDDADNLVMEINNQKQDISRLFIVNDL